MSSENPFDAFVKMTQTTLGGNETEHTETMYVYYLGRKQQTLISLTAGYAHTDSY